MPQLKNKSYVVNASRRTRVTSQAKSNDDHSLKSLQTLIDLEENDHGNYFLKISRLALI